MSKTKNTGGRPRLPDSQKRKTKTFTAEPRVSRFLDKLPVGRRSRIINAAIVAAYQLDKD